MVEMIQRRGKVQANGRMNTEHLGKGKGKESAPAAEGLSAEGAGARGATRPTGAIAVVLTPEVGMTRADCELGLLLTPRQMEVLHGVAKGWTTVIIGWNCAPRLSSKTIESHLDHIKTALGLDTLHQVRVWAVKYFLAASEFGLVREAVAPSKLRFRFREGGPLTLPSPTEGEGNAARGGGR